MGPHTDGLFHGKSHLEMDNLEVPTYFEKPPFVVFGMNCW